MAVTKIWPVRGRLDSLIRYAENEEKTRMPDLTGLAPAKDDLTEVLQYAANHSKTTQDRQLFVSGVNCLPEIARQQMELTKRQFGDTAGIIAFHAYQSFPPGEVTPEECHAIGVELARRLWGDRFQVLIATHLNTDCCHNHFVLNSVSFVDGKRYNDCRKTYRALQKASDTLCRDHGLSVVEDPSRHRTPRNLFQAEKAGEPTRYNVMRQDIDRAVLECNHFQELPTRLSKMGYEVNFSPNHKYATIKMPGDTHAVRFKTLGERYTEEALFDRVCENTVYSSLLTRQERYRRCYPPVHPHDRWKQEEFKKALLKTLGIYRTYLYYCYLLGRLPEKIPNHRPPHPAMREDLRHWEQIEAQLHLLERYSLQTREEVEQFITQKTEELQTLEARRTHCRNRLRRCRNPAECDALHTEKDQLTEKICAARKELRTAQKIPPRADWMREKIELLNTQEQQHAACREER